MSTDKARTAYVSWSVDVDCPKCEESMDLADQDQDGVVAGAIFLNRWESLSGHEVTCPHCQHEFTLAEVRC